MMATFKVGQRVRIVCAGSVFYGAEAIIVRKFFDKEIEDVISGTSRTVRLAYAVSVGGRTRHDEGSLIGYEPCDLAPLTDPGADAFIARIKKLGSEPVNDAPKVKVEAK